MSEEQTRSPSDGDANAASPRKENGGGVPNGGPRRSAFSSQTFGISDGIPADEVSYPDLSGGVPTTRGGDVDVAAELEETRARLLRSAADFDNYRKRVQRERQDTVRQANESMLRDVLPVLDNLERAVSASDDSLDTGTLYEGVRMVVQQFTAFLDQYGARRVGGRGEKFDPRWHEAMQQLHSDDLAPGYVMEELQAGYMVGDRLLRPALVIVSAPGSSPKVMPAEPAAPETAGEFEVEVELVQEVEVEAPTKPEDLDGHYIALSELADLGDLGAPLGDESEDFDEDTVPGETAPDEF